MNAGHKIRWTSPSGDRALLPHMSRLFRCLLHPWGLLHQYYFTTLNVTLALLPRRPQRHCLSHYRDCNQWQLETLTVAQEQNIEPAVALVCVLVYWRENKCEGYQRGGGIIKQGWTRTNKKVGNVGISKFLFLLLCANSRQKNCNYYPRI